MFLCHLIFSYVFRCAVLQSALHVGPLLYYQSNAANKPQMMHDMQILKYSFRAPIVELGGVFKIYLCIIKVLL